MLQAHLAEHPDRQFTLVFGVRYEHGLLNRNEFEELAQKYPNFKFLPTLSRPGDNWTGLNGHVQEHVLRELNGRLDMDVYICGLKAMVDDMRGRLKELGLDRKEVSCFRKIPD